MSATDLAQPVIDPPHNEVLRDMETRVRALIDAHLETRRLWFPNDLLPADTQMHEAEETAQRELRQAAQGIPAPVRVALALNLLTEEGLPHFHRLLSAHMGHASPWSDWNNLWTAEEDRHGCALRDYVREARLFDMRALEQLQYAYIESGFNPNWNLDPYCLLAYTSLQERATQRAHANTGRRCAAFEPQIQRTLAHIAADESRHFCFYRDCFGEVLARDPDRALVALLRIAPALAMPGHEIEGYASMAEVVRRCGIYGPRDYCQIIAELLDHWRIGTLSGLKSTGARARDKLMNLPQRLARLADYAERKTTPRPFSFDFLGAQTIRL